MAVFGSWYCFICEKSINVGTVAPRGVMSKHRNTKIHGKIAEAKRKVEEAEKLGADIPDREQRIEALRKEVRTLMRNRRF